MTSLLSERLASAAPAWWGGEVSGLFGAFSGGGGGRTGRRWWRPAVALARGGGWRRSTKFPRGSMT
ncbi:hypothetical protein MC885_017941 [Smutsia gigantea]|nr:hypothetical protein MC885_017941 [Smutsia gigantea]